MIDGRHGAWHPSSVTATAPAGAAYATVAINGWSDSNDPLWVDAVQWNYQYLPPTPTGVVQDSYVYDRDGNLISKTTADGDTETWQYNAHGQVVTHTDLSGASYRYTYDAATGQQTGENDDWSPTAQGQVTPEYVTAAIGTPNGVTDTYYADGQLATHPSDRGHYRGDHQNRGQSRLKGHSEPLLPCFPYPPLQGTFSQREKGRQKSRGHCAMERAFAT